MSQRFSLYSDLTVDENLRFWAGAYTCGAADSSGAATGLCEKTDLGRAADSAGSRPAGRLSASASRWPAPCCTSPPVVFLDEPTGGVDPEARRRFWDLIDELSAEGGTVFVTTHYMDEAERCHRVALMHAGRLLALDTDCRAEEHLRAGPVLEIDCHNASRALERLEALPGMSRRRPLRRSTAHRRRDSPKPAAGSRTCWSRPASRRGRLPRDTVARGRVHPVHPRCRGGGSAMIRRVLATTVKELLQLRRDWRTSLALLAMPVVLLLIYGFALSFDVEDIRLGVVDQSRTRASRLVVDAFLKSGYFIRTATLDDVRPTDRAVRLRRHPGGDRHPGRVWR